MEIIDGWVNAMSPRFQPPWDEGVAAALNKRFPHLAASSAAYQDTDSLVGLMDEAGISKAVLSDPHGSDALGETILDAIARFPDRFIGAAAVHPTKAAQDVADVRRLKKEGFSAVKRELRLAHSIKTFSEPLTLENPMNTLIAKEGRLVDGIVRTPGVTYQDIRAEDPNPGPDEVYGDFPQPANDFTVPNSWYFSPEHAALEKEKLWSQAWVWACRVEKIPTVGSCYVHVQRHDTVPRGNKIVLVRAESAKLPLVKLCIRRTNALLV